LYYRKNKNSDYSAQPLGKFCNLSARRNVVELIDENNVLIKVGLDDIRTKILPQFGIQPKTEEKKEEKVKPKTDEKDKPTETPKP
jgi:hypothetical protein